MYKPYFYGHFKMTKKVIIRLQNKTKYRLYSFLFHQNKIFHMFRRESDSTFDKSQITLLPSGLGQCERPNRSECISCERIKTQSQL